MTALAECGWVKPDSAGSWVVNPTIRERFAMRREQELTRRAAQHQQIVEDTKTVRRAYEEWRGRDEAGGLSHLSLRANLEGRDIYKKREKKPVTFTARARTNGTSLLRVGLHPKKASGGTGQTGQAYLRVGLHPKSSGRTWDDLGALLVGHRSAPAKSAGALLFFPLWRAHTSLQYALSCIEYNYTY